MPTALDEFIQTIARLRGPDGCPWDREQDHNTLARYLLEECYEVLEAIHEGNPAKLKEELGDLLLQIVLNAQVAKDAGEFDMQDVARSINDKMISRHPHVFGDKSLDTADQVVMQWQELKEKEKAAKDELPKSAMDGIPKTFPALLQALKISEKAVAQGFEWETEQQIWDQLHSELDELKAELAHPDAKANRRATDLELGDVLFTMVNIARWRDLNPEESLLLAIEKFKDRFKKMEAMTERPLKQLSMTELEELWKRAKALP
jgi:MazG family protein